jgi:hypothetical protein
MRCGVKMPASSRRSARARNTLPPNPDDSLPKPNDVIPNASAARPRGGALPPEFTVRLDDRAMMTFGVLGFGIAIPLLTGLYGDLPPADPRFWVGFACFIALAASIWLGNRWLLYKQREHFDWFASPWRKLAMLVSANVLFTAPLTLAALAAWYRFRGVPADVGALQLATLTNVICVVFVTHAYETVFLIREREVDLLRMARLERIRAQAELDGLKAQIDPHFLFNSLNTLGHLVKRDPAAAREFCDALAALYRHVLACRERDLVPADEELDIARAYHRLLTLRFGAAIALQFEDVGGAASSLRLPPLSLQTLLENAVKHNQLGPDAPLHVCIRVAFDGVVVENPVRLRTSARPSTGVGLRNLDERCRVLTGRGLDIRMRGGTFRVALPAVRSMDAP